MHNKTAARRSAASTTVVLFIL